MMFGVPRAKVQLRGRANEVDSTTTQLKQTSKSAWIREVSMPPVKHDTSFTQAKPTEPEAGRTWSRSSAGSWPFSRPRCSDRRRSVRRRGFENVRKLEALEGTGASFLKLLFWGGLKGETSRKPATLRFPYDSLRTNPYNEYTARAVPPHQHVPALERFDERVRHTFVNCTGVPLYEGAWRRATRGVLHGGLGLRSAARHAHAAYVASLLGARGLAGRVDAAWEAEGLPALATLQ